MRFSVFLSLSFFFFCALQSSVFFLFLVLRLSICKGAVVVSRKNEKRCANLSSELSLVAVVVLELVCVLRGKKNCYTRPHSSDFDSVFNVQCT